MKKDLRDRAALGASDELAPLADRPAFDTLALGDLRRLAELLRAAGGVERVTLSTAETVGRNRQRLSAMRRALTEMVGADHSATRAVAGALSALQHGQRQGDNHRDFRTREAVLAADHWAPFRTLATLETTDLEALRAIDRFLAFCATTGRPGGEVETFLAYAEDAASSMRLRTLRDALERLLTSAHPAVAVAEEARSAKEAERRRRRASPRPPAPPPALACSVPESELPELWRRCFTILRGGGRVNRRRYAPATIKTMIYAARQLVWTARRGGLPDDLTLATISAYDAELEKRDVRPASRSIHFDALRALGLVLGVERTLLRDLQDLVDYYDAAAKALVALKEDRLAALPDLQKIVDRANALLDEAEATRDRRKRVTFYVDAAALVFLSIIPLRNRDTVLRWGLHVRHVEHDDPAALGLADHPEPLRYYLDLRTSKTDAALSGPLAPILTPFLDALILQGRDPRLLPQLREAAIRDRAPVFPKQGGGARRVRGLSARWQVQLGTGSIISRTRIHTLLGMLGEHGVRAALALCAQRSPRTAAWYQASALGRRLMAASQEMLVDLLELTDEDVALLAALAA